MNPNRNNNKPIHFEDALPSKAELVSQSQNSRRLRLIQHITREMQAASEKGETSTIIHLNMPLQNSEIQVFAGKGYTCTQTLDLECHRHGDKCYHLAVSWD